jgi:hypothetical protein
MNTFFFINIPSLEGRGSKGGWIFLHILITPTLPLPHRGGGNYILNANNLVLSSITFFRLKKIKNAECHYIE